MTSVGKWGEDTSGAPSRGRGDGLKASPPTSLRGPLHLTRVCRPPSFPKALCVRPGRQNTLQCGPLGSTGVPWCLSQKHRPKTAREGGPGDPCPTRPRAAFVSRWTCAVSHVPHGHVSGSWTSLPWAYKASGPAQLQELSQAAVRDGPGLPQRWARVMARTVSGPYPEITGLRSV